MTKKLISILTAAMLVISMAVVALPSVSAAVDENGCYVPSEELQQDVGTNRYYFYMPSAWTVDEIKDQTDHAGIYWWDGTDVCGDADVYNPDSLKWPGYLAQKGDVEGVFYVDCPIDVTTIIWNNHFNGGEDSSDPMFKFAAQTVNIGAEYYDPGESDLYPDGTDNFDNMIYVCDPTLTSTNEVSGQKTYRGEWYYYYGNGQYGTYPTLEEAETAGEVFTGDTHIIDPNETTPDEPDPDPDTPDTGEKVIKFDVKNSGWEKVKSVYCHIWAADGTGTWPGWQSKKEKCDYNASTGIATYDLSNTGNDIKETDGKIYSVIFSTDTGMQTYDTVMSGACIGDTLYCTGNKIENLTNPYETDYEALWKNNTDCGPLKGITSSGKVVGSTYLAGTTNTTLLADFLIKYYNDETKIIHTQNLIEELGVSPLNVISVAAMRLSLEVESGTISGTERETILSAISKILTSFDEPDTPIEKEDSYTWTIDEYGTLHISGTGVINPDETSMEEYIPWYSQRESIKNVVIEDGITGIGNYAFFECNNLETVSIPQSVTYVGNFVFLLTDNLQSIDVDVNNENYTSSFGVLFNKDMTEIIKFPNGRSGNYTIPDTVNTINTCAFRECAKLTELEIPESVTTIESYALYNCDSLLTVTIPDSVTEILDYCGLGYKFQKGSDEPIEGFTIKGYTGTAAETYAKENGFDFISLNEESKTDFEYEILDDGTAEITDYTGSATQLTIPSELDGYSVESIRSSAFWNCTSLISVTIPNSIKNIGDEAFSYCTNLERVTIPDSVTNIGDMVFDNCKNLKSVTIPDSITNIGYSVFNRCESLVSVILPNSITEIDNSAFAGCKSLTEINIPDSVTRLGGGAFQSTNIKSIEIPNSVTEIEDCLFVDCTNLTNIVLPDNITKIGVQAFQGCKNLNNVIIPDSVKEIEIYAFDMCYSLSNITLPNGLESIGAMAFSLCKNLKEITIPESVTEIGEYALGYDNLYGESKLFEPVKIAGFTIKGYTGTAGETYAKDNGFEFISIDDQQAGDINSDGTIDVSDATLIQKAVAGSTEFTAEQKTAADVNGDGEVSVIDVTLIQKYAAGVITEF